MHLLMLAAVLGAAPTLSVGMTHSCATRGGKLYCWGENGWGQLGQGDRKNREGARRVAGLENVTKVLAVSNRTCALDGGKLYCWGAAHNEHDGFDAVTQPKRVELEGDVTDFAMGSDHVCAVVATQVLCWGRNDINGGGQLGAPLPKGSAGPIVAGRLDGVSRVTAGSYHTCALTLGGAVWCWGPWSLGKMFPPESIFNATKPTVFPGLEKGVTALWESEDSTASCVRQSGAVRCWGFIGAEAAVEVPREVPALAGSTALGLGSSVCAVLDHRAHCWTGVLKKPEPVKGLPPVRDAQAGTRHSCAITDGGDVFCWGENQNNYLGNKGTEPSPSPVAVVFGE